MADGDGPVLEEAGPDPLLGAADDLPASDLDLVRALPLFSRASPEVFRDVTAGAFLQRFPAGTTLLMEGDTVDFLYVLLEGAVELQGSWKEKETTLALLRPVSTFILAAVVLDADALMSARTLERSEILMLSGEALRRTMRQDAEVAGKAVWAEKDDPRITRLGYWLRKLRIDELPQTWTVLKGEMSFVGPRPERRQFVEDLEQHLRYYAERHMVKPGITGWAQINYPYGASIEDARHKLEYDLYYAKNYTPFLDLLILIQTLRVVLWPDGAR